MGHKVSPIVLRLGINRNWSSRWFASSKKSFVAYLREDTLIRETLEKELEAAAVAGIEIERSPDRVRIFIRSARPGVVIGRRGENIQRIEQAVQKIVGATKQLKVETVEVGNPYTEAVLIAKSICFQLEKRIAHRRAMKRAIQQAMEGGAKGIKIVARGRLGGSEMTRRESYRNGKVPLGTLRSAIDYGQATARTTTGAIGLKVWVFRGEGDLIRRPSPGRERESRESREARESRQSSHQQQPKPVEAAPAPAAPASPAGE